jgi:NhaP-type Na+/H+ or K+/H+ antiporter
VDYFLGEFLGLSGIISLFTTAIIFSKYGFNNLSEESKRGTVLAFDSIRYVFQAFIFAYLGTSLLSITLQWKAIGLALIIILLIPIIRFLSLSVLPLFYKLTRKHFPLPKP